MKPLAITIIFYILLCGVFGCVSLTPSMPQEYYQGRQHAEKAAKTDAINDHCIRYREFLRFADVYATRHLNRHLNKLKPSHDSQFINGFQTAYPGEYKRFIEFYCSD